MKCSKCGSEVSSGLEAIAIAVIVIFCTPIGWIGMYIFAALFGFIEFGS